MPGVYECERNDEERGSLVHGGEDALVELGQRRELLLLDELELVHEQEEVAVGRVDVCCEDVGVSLPESCRTKEPRWGGRCREHCDRPSVRSNRAPSAHRLRYWYGERTLDAECAQLGKVVVVQVRVDAEQADRKSVV